MKKLTSIQMTISLELNAFYASGTITGMIEGRVISTDDSNNDKDESNEEGDKDGVVCLNQIQIPTNYQGVKIEEVGEPAPTSDAKIVATTTTCSTLQQCMKLLIICCGDWATVETTIQKKEEEALDPQLSLYWKMIKIVMQQQWL